MLDIANPPIQALAEEFSRLLRRDLGPELMKEVIRLNKTCPPGTCASHDFCDANMVMHEAQINLKLDLDLGLQSNLDIWSGAWDLAFKKEFFNPEA